MKTTVVLFVPPGICRDCRKSVLESSISSVARITSTDMEEGAACATPLTDLESLSCTLGHVTLVWTIILQYTVTIVTSNLQVIIYFVYKNIKLTLLLLTLINTYNGHFSVSPVKKKL